MIRDDGSTDGTVAICEQYAQKYSNIDFAVNEHNKGCAMNFMDMVYAADADAYDYFAFSDQDDYWLPEKLSKAIEQLRATPAAVSALYYSDVCNVDADLSNGRAEYQPFLQYAKSLKALLLLNWASGCTMVWNGAMQRLLQLAPLQRDVCFRLHDSWVHLVGLTCGQVHADLNHSYIKRRITGENLGGERRFGEFSLRRLWRHLLNLLSPSKNEFIQETVELLNGYGSKMSDEDRRTIQLFVAGKDSFVARCRTALDSGYCLPSRKETLLMRLRLLANRL